MNEAELKLWCEQTRELGAQAREKKGKFPLNVFLALSEATVTNPVEVIAVRRRPNAAPEVLLTLRPQSDPFFAGMWHTPGGMLRPGTTTNGVLEEVVATEVVDRGTTNWAVRARFPGIDVPYGTGLGQCPRGQYLCSLHIVEVTNGWQEDDEHRWYPWYGLPTDKMPTYQVVHLLPVAIKWIRENLGS